MNDKEAFLNATARQLMNSNIPLEEVYEMLGSSAPIPYPPDPNALCNCVSYEKVPKEFQGSNLRIDELSTIRKLLEQCTIDATRRVK